MMAWIPLENLLGYKEILMKVIPLYASRIVINIGQAWS